MLQHTRYSINITAQYYLIFSQLTATRASTLSTSLRPAPPSFQVNVCPRIRESLIKQKAHFLDGVRRFPLRNWPHFGDPGKSNNILPFDGSYLSLGAAHFGWHASLFAVFRWIDDKSRRTYHLYLFRRPPQKHKNVKNKHGDWTSRRASEAMYIYNSTHNIVCGAHLGGNPVTSEIGQVFFAFFFWLLFEKFTW